MSRNTAVVEMPQVVDTIAEIQIPRTERESVDNDFYIFNRYINGAIKKALFNAPKGDITITITRR